jgi:hypothetical protein
MTSHEAGTAERDDVRESRVTNLPAQYAACVCRVQPAQVVSPVAQSLVHHVALGAEIHGVATLWRYSRLTLTTIKPASLETATINHQVGGPSALCTGTSLASSLRVGASAKRRLPCHCLS